MLMLNFEKGDALRDRKQVRRTTAAYPHPSASSSPESAFISRRRLDAIHTVDACTLTPSTDPAARACARPPCTNPPETRVLVQALLLTQGLRLQHPLASILGTRQEMDALLESALQSCRVLALDSVTPLHPTGRLCLTVCRASNTEPTHLQTVECIHLCSLLPPTRLLLVAQEELYFLDEAAAGTMRAQVSPRNEASALWQLLESVQGIVSTQHHTVEDESEPMLATAPLVQWVRERCNALGGGDDDGNREDALATGAEDDEAGRAMVEWARAAGVVGTVECATFSGMACCSELSDARVASCRARASCEGAACAREGQAVCEGQP
jgi:hypothetical protein